MSLLRDFQSLELTAFGGAWLLQDPSTVPVVGALRSRNVEFTSGMVGVRKGFVTTAQTTSLGAIELYCWYAPFSQISSAYSDSATVIASGGSFLGTGLFGMAIKTIAGSGSLSASSSLTGTPVPTGATFVGVGMRLYAAVYGSRQQGLAPGGVTTASNSAGSVAFTALGAFNMFTGPSTYTPGAPAEPGAGVVTAGTHRIGYLIELASGFTTRVSPDSAATTPPSVTTFTPIVKVATGSKNLAVTFTNTWDSEVVAISLVMTTTTNLNQYYIVPGTRTAVSASFTITFNISDADLSSQGLDATPYLYWLTQGATITGTASPTTAPFFARHLALLGDRMGYLGTVTDNKGNTNDALYVSERNNYQAITADQHLIQLPGQRQMTSLFRMGGMSYITGPHEISGVTDNGDVPATWAAPALIDGRHGTPAIHGVEVSPSGNYSWLGDQSGLYVFTGAPITSLPVSYQQSPDWDRINWEAAYCFKIKDDASNSRVYVMAALDGATTPSHILTWDYTEGTAWNQVKYSLNNISGYSLGTMELVRNDLTSQATGNQRKIELWVASSATGTQQVMRQKSDLDTTPYRDVSSTAINAVYRTCPLPGRGRAGVILMHHGFHARIKGAGTITPTLYDIDAVRSFAGRTLTLATAPDADSLFLAEIRGELGFVEFATNTADTYWQLAYLKYYYSPYLMQR